MKKEIAHMQSGMPRHIAFLIDGNRRWAKKRGKPGYRGHYEGAKRVYELIQVCAKQRIPHLTFWGLSTENFRERAHMELRSIFSLNKKAIELLYALNRKKWNLRFRVIGSMKRLPGDLQKMLKTCERKTKKNTGTTVIAAINYGGRNELVRVMKKMIKSGNPVSEKNFAACLDTAGIPDPDLIIRTGGRNRLSGFMPWQSVYSELYFTDTLWPDFSEQELDKAIAWFRTIQRNFGK